MHLESESENGRKTLIYTQQKISRYNPHFLAIFRQILSNWPPTYLLWSDLWLKGTLPSVQRPDYSKWLCPKTLYNPFKRYAVKLPLEMFQTLAKKFQGKAVQSKTLWPNLNKIDDIIFYHDPEPKGTLTSDSCARLVTQIPMLSNCWGCSQIVLTSHPYPLQAHTSGMHLEPGNKKHEENMHFHIEKIFQKKLTPFLYF